MPSSRSKILEVPGPRAVAAALALAAVVACSSPSAPPDPPAGGGGGGAAVAGGGAGGRDVREPAHDGGVTPVAGTIGGTAGAPGGKGGALGAVDGGSAAGAPVPAGGAPGGLGFTIPADSPPDAPAPACAREVSVGSDAALTAALAAAMPGDCLVLADGRYRAPKIVAKGTAAAPIVVRAKNALGAAFDTGQLVMHAAEHVVLQGLTIATASTFKMIDCAFCRITRCRFRLTVEDDWLILYGAGSHDNRIDHGDFGPKPTPGPMLVFGQEATMSKRDRVDHNHFHDTGPPAVNEKETVRVGWSGVSMQDGLATVEQNLFEACDGDPEIVSVKSGKNVVRYNTVRASTGVLSLRHGNGSLLYGNYVFGAGKTLPCTDAKGAATTCETGGIRLYGRDHVVFDNYVEGTTGTGHRAPIQIDGGDGTSLDSHAQVVNVRVLANTFVDNASGIEIGKNYALPPKDVVVAYNVVRGPSGKLVQVFKPQATVTFAGNVVWADAGADVGATLTAAQARVIDPKLVRLGDVLVLAAGSPAIDGAAALAGVIPTDVDGQPRTTPDVGADEQGTALGPRRPLTAADVGPEAP